jgi:phage shock protein E
MNKRKNIIIVLCLIVILISSSVACTNKTQDTENNSNQKTEEIVKSDETDITDKGDTIEKAEYETITPAATKKILDEDNNSILLDVRTESEYKSKHIPNSKLIPLDELENRAEEELTDKNAVILVYCRSGNRSKTASKKLLDLGYQNVYDLGGIIDWPYETES